MNNVVQYEWGMPTQTLGCSHHTANEINTLLTQEEPSLVSCSLPKMQARLSGLCRCHWHTTTLKAKCV